MAIDSLADPWTPADIDGWVGDAIGDAPWVIVGALTRDDFPLETLAALTARGHGLIVDAQGLVRHGRVGPLVSDGDDRPRRPRPHHRAQAQRRGGRAALRRHRRGIAPVARHPRDRAHARLRGRRDHLGRDHDARGRGAGRRARSTRREPATRSCSPMRRRASGASSRTRRAGSRAGSSRPSSRADGGPRRDLARVRGDRPRDRRRVPRRRRSADRRPGRGLAAARDRRHPGRARGSSPPSTAGRR